MNPNIFVAASDKALDQLSEFAVLEIDGRKSRTLRLFYEHIADVLHFPDYFGYNLDSLDDMLNDLDWIEDNKIALHFTHVDDLISQERNPDKLHGLLHMLDATAEDWKWVDEDEDIAAKELVIVFEDNPRIRRMLEQEDIAYKPLDTEA